MSCGGNNKARERRCEPLWIREHKGWYPLALIKEKTSEGHISYMYELEAEALAVATGVAEFESDRESGEKT